MTIELSRFDAAEYLDDKETQEYYIQDAFSTGDSSQIKEALSTVIRARGITEAAKVAGISRQGLAKALSENGDPKLSTVLSILKALDIPIGIANENSYSEKLEEAQ